jgi:hypothetical protein
MSDTMIEEIGERDQLICNCVCGKHRQKQVECQVGEPGNQYRVHGRVWMCGPCATWTRHKRSV